MNDEATKVSQELIDEVGKQTQLMNSRWKMFTDKKQGPKTWDAFMHLEISTLYALHIKTLDILRAKRS